jgi:hypothetical protein
MPWPDLNKAVIVSAEDFFSRWAKKNQQAQEAKAAEVPPSAPDPFEGRAPTLEDLEQITPQADFSPFMKEGVDETVKRSALRKLFSDPHFNIMDGLDVYIDDYTKPDPIPPEMMAMLNHAKDLFHPPGLRDAPVMALQDREEAPKLEASEVEANASSGDEDAGAQAALEAQGGQEQEGAQDQQNAQDQAQHDTENKDGQSAAGQDRPGTPATPAANHTSGTDPETETPQT